MMPKLKPWLFLSLIFIAGITTGIALSIGFASHFAMPPGAQQMKSRWKLHLTHQLNLTADQQARIDPILTESENQIQAARHDNIDRVSQIIQKTNEQIVAILTPEQKAQFEAMCKAMERDRDKMFPGHHSWGGPHGGPGSDGGMMPPPLPPPAPDH